MLKIQEMLHICSEHFEQKDDDEKDKDSKDKDAKDKEKDKKEAEKSDDGSHQGVAVLGIALIAMGEEIGAQMALRTCNHLVRSLVIIKLSSSRKRTPSGSRKSVRNRSWPLVGMCKYRVCMS